MIDDAPMLKDWDTDGAGHLKVWPLLDFSTAIFGFASGGVRLEIGEERPAPGAEIPALQLVLSPDQMRALGSALVEMADQLGPGKVGRG